MGVKTPKHLPRKNICIPTEDRGNEIPPDISISPAAGNPIVPQPSTAEADEKNFRLFERSEFLKFRQVQGAQGSPTKEGQGTGRPFFWFVFFGRQRK
jgi:hypothetical protein